MGVQSHPEEIYYEGITYKNGERINLRVTTNDEYQCPGDVTYNLDVILIYHKVYKIFIRGYWTNFCSFEYRYAIV